MMYLYYRVFRIEITCTGVQVDLVFAIDESGSIESENFALVRQFVSDFVEGFSYGDNGIRVGVVTFASDASNRFFLNTYATRNEVVAAILALPYTEGGTHTDEALRAAQTEQFTAVNGDRPDAPNILIVLTDGLSNGDSDAVVQAEQTRAAGIRIYAIGVGDGVNEDELRLMSSEPQQLGVNYFLSSDFAELSELSGGCTVNAGSNNNNTGS